MNFTNKIGTVTSRRPLEKMYLENHIIFATKSLFPNCIFAIIICKDIFTYCVPFHTDGIKPVKGLCLGPFDTDLQNGAIFTKQMCTV